MRDDLALHALQGVVDRLGVAAQLFGHLLVGRAFEVEPERIGFELRETRAEAEDQALQLLGRDDADGGIVDTGAGQGVAERALAVGVLAGGGLAEGDVGIERRVLETGRGLDRGDDLARHAELGE